jgi:hypothetical protein
LETTPQTELLAALPQVVASLARGERAASDVAVGITTTDLAYKSTALTVQLDGQEVRMGGCVKGSGMIHPNMATMLGVVTCDAAVDPFLWRQMVAEASANSFNQVGHLLPPLLALPVTHPSIGTCSCFHPSMTCVRLRVGQREVEQTPVARHVGRWRLELSFVLTALGADHCGRRHVHERLRGGHGQRLRRQRHHSRRGQC